MGVWFAVAKTGTFPTYFVAVYVVGLVAAVVLGLIAWYNSKRPVGWENSQRPDLIPDLKLDQPTKPDVTPEKPEV